MIRTGIVGLGFMGKMHFRCYQALEGVQVAAICDIDETKFENTSGTAGNIAGAEAPLDFTGIGLYTDFDKMLAEANLDAISITLPTYLHKDHTVKALGAGLNVLCEKPMALTVEDGRAMQAAAEKSGRLLQIGHCIRFWPEYAKTKELIDSGQYGKIRAAMFQRLSLTPGWAWDGWLMDPARSGSAAVDLHIHDSDYVQYVFGMPKAVFSRTARGPSNDADHIVTQYVYEEDCVVTAEGGWAMSPTFGFEMSFNIVLEKATIVYDCTRSPAFKVCPVEGDAFTPEVASGDGYSNEIAHFVKAVRGESVPQIITPGQSVDSVRLVLAEKHSARSGEKVSL
ncbi:MAG: Gfo/Idh/MocA family oxidoreductase [Planctomycetaceae bacterium]|nr:Gfo/Idh/MocA family oxidoreductase [Planctomycetaceae bacterium]